MSTERFDLRKNSNIIYLYYRNGRKVNLRYSTRIKIINPKHWDKKNQKIRESKNERGAFGKNTELRKIMRFFTDSFPDNKSEKELKKLLDDEFRKPHTKPIEVENDKIELFEYFKSVIDNDITKSTKSSYQNSYNHLKRFNDKLTFADIDLNFYDNYTKFLRTVRTTHKGKTLPKGYAPNTIAASIKVLKTVMGKAYKRSLHSNRSYSLDEFKVEFEEGEHLYLDDSEIDKIIALELENIELIDTRKYFIIGCYSGLRISDVLRLNENFFNDDMIVITPFKGDRTTKKNKPLTISVNTKIKDIISDGLPKTNFHNDAFNKNIKKLCELAGISVFNEVTSHTMRRSFASNASLSGVSDDDISFFLGHSNTRITRNYIKISDTTKAKLIQKRNDFLK